MDYSKVTHVLLGCGWVPVDKGTFKKITNDSFEFFSENKKIWTQNNFIQAIKFEK